ncbi:Putative uncharacterized protein [Mycoavidus cysteinexigens]|uniref:Uncharacterized protein n=1 Tax=Mycoavidus cysteinexigens TaxID=1553431 RepID=A0A2Z6EV46_9BURK|nr:hypothetical protein [Mycoavidus cysteinexigens]BBE09343.1 Putative uncharacterized protein [Mycoavidus cysteinexigens]GLR01929.1 hypothetical protein GCM10007934_17420 [Mycoavidus cysteinexigens]
MGSENKEAAVIFGATGQDEIVEGEIGFSMGIFGSSRGDTAKQNLNGLNLEDHGLQI